MERELSGPIRHFFEEQGYVCDGEVRGIDLYMERGDVRAAVELKETLDFRLVQQAALRQKSVERVYAGIFLPKNIYSQSMKDRMYLLKRLGIGLVTVSKRSGLVQVVLEAADPPEAAPTDKKEREALSAEFNGRVLKNNTGGVRGEKLMTNYREEALLVLEALLQLEGKAQTPACPMALAGSEEEEKTGTHAEGREPGVFVRRIREASGVDRTAAILHDDHYGWFTHVRRGVYAVSASGIRAAAEYEEVIRRLKG